MGAIEVRCPICDRTFWTVPGVTRATYCSITCTRLSLVRCVCTHERADHGPVGCLIVGCGCPSEVGR